VSRLIPYSTSASRAVSSDTFGEKIFSFGENRITFGVTKITLGEKKIPGKGKKIPSLGIYFSKAGKKRFPH
jgi:hypothetical protein